jgi:predicted ArsR family transcriptional regulator
MEALPQLHVVRAEKQLSVLASAARQEIVDVLVEIGPASVAQIAATVGRPADALYFHLRALKRAGLVKQDGYRALGGRRELLYRTVARQLALHYEPRNEVNRRAVTALVNSMSRLGGRDFGRAFRQGDVIVAGPQREIWATRKTARMSRSRIAAVNRRIQGLMNALSKRGATGRLYAITVILTPLDHRSRESKRSARPQRKVRK